MNFETQLVIVGNILTRACGFLSTVCSHSLQPYRGCAFGRSLCGQSCYVRHNGHITLGRTWGDFLEVRTNAAKAYAAAYERERRWARAAREGFSVFLSSATEPFPPQERRYGVTAGVLDAMIDLPPDTLIVQTHSAFVARPEILARLVRLRERTQLRMHISIETDMECIPGLPPPACSVADRFAAAAAMRGAGVFTVIAVSPLLPIADPHAFFRRVAQTADAVILDHFIQGDGTPQGTRTKKTPLPAAMAAVDPMSVELAYRDRMVAIAAIHLPNRVGVNRDGFAGRWLDDPPAAPPPSPLSPPSPPSRD